MDWHVRLTALLNVRLFSISGTDTTVGSALTIAVIVAAAYLLARNVHRLVAHNFRRRGMHDDIALAAMTSVLQVVVWLIGVEIGLKLLGVSLATLFAATGFLALGASFAVKGLVESWLAGLILRLEQTIKPGDVIVVDNRWLQVQRIGLRTTAALSSKNEEMVIPNSIIGESVVINLTRHDRLFRLEATVGVPYGSDLDLVRKTLETTVDDLKWRSTKQAPAVYLTSLGRFSVNYATHVWIDDVRQTLRSASDLNEAIWNALKRAGVVIASS